MNNQIYELSSPIDEERLQWKLSQVLQCDTGLTGGDCLDPVVQGGNSEEKGAPTEVRPLSWKCTVHRLVNELCQGRDKTLTVMLDLGKACHNMRAWLWLGQGLSPTDPQWGIGNPMRPSPDGTNPRGEKRN